MPKGDSTASTRPPLNDRLPAADLAGRNPRANVNGVLAGQVIDTFNQRRAGVTISVQAVDGGETKQVVTNDQGYFTINGLQGGKKYKLLAKTKQGDVQVSGSTEATSPNVVVLIKLSHSLAQADGKPMGLSGSAGGLHSSVAEQAWQGAGNANNNLNPGAPGDRLGPASEMNSSPPVNNPPIGNARLGRPVASEPTGPINTEPLRPEYTTRNDALPSSSPPALLNIPGPLMNRNDRTRSNESSSVSNDDRGSSQYLDHPLFDLERRPTTLGALKGKLTLVDIWGTWCTHCIRGMPELVSLQRRYGSKGLVVVGIAAQEQGEPASVASHIRFITNRNGVNYPIVMEQGNQPVVQAFRVGAFPTLFLLDENGREVWRSEGLSPDSKKKLEEELKRRLE